MQLFVDRVLRKIANTFTLVVIGVFLLNVQAWADAGRIEAGEGDIRVIGDDGSNKASDIGSPLNAGDIVSTAGQQSWAILRMVDGASFTLRPNTRLRIDKYRYDEAQPTNNSSWMTLLKGSLRAITGLVGHQSPSAYALNTPTATIGIRGTDHETTVVDETQATAQVQPGTYDSVNSGETVLRNEHGEVAIQPGKVGFLHHNGTLAPAVLAQRPAFFQRLRTFDERHGIVNVLGQLHQSAGNGAFTAHPDLRERLKQEMNRPPEWLKNHPAKMHAQQAFGAARQERMAAAREGGLARNGLAQRRAAAMAARREGERRQEGGQAWKNRHEGNEAARPDAENVHEHVDEKKQQGQQHEARKKKRNRKVPRGAHK